MIIKGKEFKFKSSLIDYMPLEYSVHWEKYIAGSDVTITRSNGLYEGVLHIDGRELQKFIKELQILVEFMKNDGLLVEEEKPDEDR